MSEPDDFATERDNEDPVKNVREHLRGLYGLMNLLADLDYDSTGETVYEDTKALETELVRLHRERQAVLDVINLYGDKTLHDALDGIGWP